MSDDLIKRLNDGIVEHDKRWSGDTHDDLGGSVDQDATEAVMREAAAALSEAHATIARLEAENADLRHDLVRLKESETEQLNRAERLEAALRPFAQEHAWGPDDRFEIVLAGQYGSITGSDLDRARAALSPRDLGR